MRRLARDPPALIAIVLENVSPVPHGIQGCNLSRKDVGAREASSSAMIQN